MNFNDRKTMAVDEKGEITVLITKTEGWMEKEKTWKNKLDCIDDSGLTGKITVYIHKDRPENKAAIVVNNTIKFRAIVNEYKEVKYLTAFDDFTEVKADIKQASKPAGSTNATNGKGVYAPDMTKDDWEAKERREYLDKAINTIISKYDVGANKSSMDSAFEWAKSKVMGLFMKADPNDSEPKQDPPAEKEEEEEIPF